MTAWQHGVKNFYMEHIMNHTSRKIYLVILGVLALVAGLTLSVCRAQEPEPGMVCDGDGSGRVFFFWAPTGDIFPDRGWQLRRLSDKTIVKRWQAASRLPALRRLRPKKAEEAEALFTGYPISNKEEKETVLGLILFGTGLDFAMARAMGLGCVLEAEKGEHRYALELTDRSGKVVKKRWVSPPVDGWRMDHPPAVPTDFRGTSRKRDIALWWQPPSGAAQKMVVPVASFSIERKNIRGNWERIGSAENIRIESETAEGEKRPAPPQYIDRTAPLERESEYRIRSIDLFGRRSPSVKTRVFFADVTALLPPKGFIAEEKRNAVKLEWRQPDSPFTAGYVLERQIIGLKKPWDLLTPDGLSRKELSYTDTTAVGGINYRYRIRSMNPRGKVGEEGSTAAVTPLTTGPPPRPEKLQAKVDTLGVSLEWDAGGEAVGHSIVERRPSGTRQWERISSALYRAAQYRDPFPINTIGAYDYRVITVGLDGKKSKPSKEITVKLLGKPVIPVPYLQEVRSDKGEVELTFKPGAGNGAKLTKSFLVVRGNDPKDVGLIIGEPIKGSKTSFTDTMVLPGEDYWYGLIAVGEDGRRSKMSQTRMVRVAPKKIPQAARPRCTFKKEPFPRVEITFKKPPRFLLAAVVRKADGQDRWYTIADNLQEDRIIDADPPRSGDVSYAVFYKSEKGAVGELSESRMVAIEN